MDTTNSSEKPQRRVEDRKLAEVIDWAVPGAPAVPSSPATTPGIDEFIVYGRAGNRRVDLEAKLRDALAAEACAPAATSGDAPDLQQLKALALAVGDDAFDVGLPSDAAEEFMAKVSPAVVLGLIAHIEGLNTSFELARANYEQVVAKNAELNARIESAAAPATASGDELPPLSDAEYQSILGPVLSREGMRRYRNADPLNLDPSDLRAMIDRARAAVSAATKPTADSDLRKSIREMATMLNNREWANFLTTDPDLSALDAEISELVTRVTDAATKPAAAPAVPEELRKALCSAVTKCGHMIETDFVKLYRNPKAEGNALSQLLDRIEAAATPAASTTGAAQTAEQVRTAVARAIWNLRREEEDRCDMELEDMGQGHSVWQEADAAIQVMSRPTPTHSSEAGDAS